MSVHQEAANAHATGPTSSGEDALFVMLIRGNEDRIWSAFKSRDWGRFLDAYKALVTLNALRNQTTLPVGTLKRMAAEEGGSPRAEKPPGVLIWKEGLFDQEEAPVLADELARYVGGGVEAGDTFTEAKERAWAYIALVFYKLENNMSCVAKTTGDAS